MVEKRLSAEQAARLIKDGDTIAITGSGGGLLEADTVFAAIEDRFLREGRPRDLTLVHSLGLGDRGRRGTNRFARETMLKRVIGGHYTWSPLMQALAKEEKIEAYTLPSGVISLLLREIGAGRPGLFTHVGLGTFADPRLGGGRGNRRAIDPLVELVTIDGKEFLRYKAFSVNVGIVRGTYADADGNVSLVGEPADLDVFAIAIAAHNSGGKVIAQVREGVERGSIPPRQVTIPARLVDAVVVDPAQMQTYRSFHEPGLSGEMRTVTLTPSEEDRELGLRQVVARRAAAELTLGAVVNFGFGMSSGVAALIARRGEADRYSTTIEQGIYGGAMVDGPLFGMSVNPTAIIDSPSQFDFYSGGGLDITFLGMGEVDQAGNVNVSHLDGELVGPGGFVDISQNAKKVVFCGSFDAKGARLEIQDGGLKIVAHGRIRKFVENVAEITFSGSQALARRQEVVYVTERAVFRLAPEGVELVEIAKGVDLERDVLACMGFVPVIRRPVLMNEAHFRP